eukprot:5566451-Alexandrium_andersonii.AAC.1
MPAGSHGARLPSIVVSSVPGRSGVGAGQCGGTWALVLLMPWGCALRWTGNADGGASVQGR